MVVLSLGCRQVGGPDRVRTDDLLDANQALSQLSYGPKDLAMDAHCALPKNLGASTKHAWGGLESRINSEPLRVQRMEMLTFGHSVERRSLERR